MTKECRMTKPEDTENHFRHFELRTSGFFRHSSFVIQLAYLRSTSGTPLRWLDTPESWDWMLESWMEILRVAGARAGDRIYFAFSFGPFIGFWLAFEAAARLGCLCLPGGGLSSAARLRAILDNEVTILCCT